VEATAEFLLKDPRAVVRIDCAEFQHRHEIAKLIGSPPGYLGHRETPALLSQEALDQYHTEKIKLSFVSSMKSKKRPMQSGIYSWAFWTKVS
jgi:ATP-dependent Clp protease ATP-binding subunit ClpB